MQDIPVLGPDALRMHLDFRGLIDKIREVLLSDSVAPVRASLTHNAVWLGAMPAAGLGLQVVKIVGVYPGNPARGLPTVRGVLLAFEEGSGELLFMADAGPVTGYRTAAASCLALGLMGYRGGGPVGLLVRVCRLGTMPVA